jgi:hypothetical protein
MTKLSRKSEEPLIIDLTEKFLEDSKGYQQKLGRYSSSSIYKMLNHAFLPWGTPPTKYFDIEEPTIVGAMRMKQGTQSHELVQKYLPQNRNEIKFEYAYYGDGDPRNCSKIVPPYPAKAEPLAEEPIFIVVGKVDHLHDDYVIEIKTSTDVFKASKDYHDLQSKLYCTICERPSTYIVQPLVSSNRLVLKEIGVVDRDDEWFASEMRKLNNYHERLVLIQQERARLAD